MTKYMIGILILLFMVSLVIGVDVLFLRNRFWERLLANVGIVVLFGTLYLRFLK